MPKILLTVFLTSLSPLAFGFCKWNSAKTAVLDTSVVNEASGIATARLQKDRILWINDSGSKEFIHASDLNGKIVKSVAVQNFPNKDYEAMAISSCPDDKNQSCIYIADIGDNKEWRSEYRVGIFKEADFWKNTSIVPQQVIRFQYPKGNHNAESFIVTPEGKFLIFSKTKSGISQIFQVEANARVTEIGQLNVKEITGTQGDALLITDATISQDGKTILILTYGDIIEIQTEAVLNISRRTLKKGVDYEVIKGPGFEQQETITFTNPSSFIVSTEIENGGVADIVTYQCKSL